MFYVDKETAEYNFWEQMLTGDAGDNIKAIKGVGKRKAWDILTAAVNYEDGVKTTYEKHFGEAWLAKYDLNYRLLKLGRNC